MNGVNSSKPGLGLTMTMIVMMMMIMMILNLDMNRIFEAGPVKIPISFLKNAFKDNGDKDNKVRIVS